MNSQNDPLDRLLKSAARAPKAEPGAPRFALEASVLARWRSGPNEDGDFLVGWFRRATLCACALAVVSLAWNYHTLAGTHKGDGELVVADATMKTGVEP
jgi:hypothetical protein